MKTVMITGAAGFIGKNLIAALPRRDDVRLIPVDVETSADIIDAGLSEVDIIYHLAGVNRPKQDSEFIAGNTDLTKQMLSRLCELGRTPTFVFSSSVQATLDNSYGRSKRMAEEEVLAYSRTTGASVCIYRFPGVFGKWSRPNYNTVVATFCHNIARGLEIQINDPNRELELVYIDDVVAAFLKHLGTEPLPTQQYYEVSRSFRVTLGELAEKIRQLGAIRETLMVPDLSDDLLKNLHATFLSFLPEDEFARQVELKIDNRGWLFELIKSKHFGQIFVSKTHPGITRGNHYHDTKIEKFCVIQGEGVIRFRHIASTKVIEYPVDGSNIKVVDIPPGYTHSIQNTGTCEMICLFWANHIFNPDQTDTYVNSVFNSHE
ncbi:NAD-dependent epimerase/dehydratase family protein [bacterium]|nr:NAD-dependent epimerase/dehydratase family protein [bacterium]